MRCIICLICLTMVSTAFAASATPVEISKTIPTDKGFIHDFEVRLINDVLIINVSPDADAKMKDGKVDGGAPVWVGQNDPAGKFVATGTIPPNQAGQHDGQFAGKYIKTGGGGGVVKWKDWNGEALISTIKLKKVTFGGTTLHAVRQDNGSGVYTAPHWLDGKDDLKKVDTDDGAADKVGEHRFPVAYTRNTKPSLEAVFTISTAPASSTSFKIRGMGPDKIEFTEKQATIAGCQLTYPMTEASKALPNTVKFYKTFDVTWEISYDGGSWRKIGKSDNRMYVTLRNPVGGQFETLYELGCKNADGSTDAAATTAKCWAEFTDRVVKRKPIDGYNNPDGHALSYYKTYKCGVIETAGLLKNGDGQCGSWAKLFIDMLKAQGVDNGGDYVIIRPVVTGTGFMIRSWSFKNGPTSGPIDFPFFNVIDGGFPPNGPSYKWLYNEVTDGMGVAGQSNKDPASLFENHQVVKIGTTYYDPSYGTMHASLAAFESNAIVGFYKIRTTDVAEMAISVDLNKNGNMLDTVRVLGFFAHENKTGLDIKRTIYNY